MEFRFFFQENYKDYELTEDLLDAVLEGIERGKVLELKNIITGRIDYVNLDKVVRFYKKD